MIEISITQAGPLNVPADLLSPSSGACTRTLRTRLSMLMTGLVFFGVSIALLVRAGLGLDPWDVFHEGLAATTGMSFGWVLMLVGTVVMLLWIPLRQRPGIGTLFNVVVVGVTVDVTLAAMPIPEGMAVRWTLLVAGVVLNGVATGLYLGARLGPGPRDGLMTGLARSGRSIRTVRTGIEVTVLSVGWLLGGTVGLGTLVYAASIGPLAQLFIGLFTDGAGEAGCGRDGRLSGRATTATAPVQVVADLCSRDRAHGRRRVHRRVQLPQIVWMCTQQTCRERAPEGFDRGSPLVTE